MGAQDQRPHFYEGQYLAAADLAAIVEYLRAADSRHALGAHTWGIALGLYLVERPAPGPAGRQEVILLPGVAWDGYGRALVVTRPTRLPESLFSTIPYDENLDADQPKGHAVRVWLNYREIAARQPPPGFESCADADQNARVAEGFEFLVREVSQGMIGPQNVMVGTETLPAERALLGFDPQAPRLYDTSVPHQTFPAGKPPLRWPIPLGYVRWVAREDDTGYFAARDGVTEYRLKDCTRAFRRYIGAVVENLIAADGAIVLQRRGENPRARHRLAYLLNCGHKSEELLEDLAWIEGDLRVVGDAKLAGGKLLLRDADGFDEGVPIYLERVGDDPQLEQKKCCEDLDAAADAAGAAAAAAALAKAPRELRVALGKKGQNSHRFIVGPEVAADAKAADPKPSLEPRFVVLSGTGETDNQDLEGRAGVNTRTPNAALEVKGDWNGQDGALRLSGQQPAIRYEGGADVGTTWLAQTTSNPKGAFRLARWDTAGAKWVGALHVTPGHRLGVGVDLKAPKAPLAVKAQPPETGTDAQKALWDELVSLEDRGGSAKWHLNLRIDAGQKHLNFAETGVADARLFLKAGGNVGVGTTDPQRTLHVAGDAVVDGRAGIGTANPQQKLHVQGDRIRLETGGKRIELRADGGAVDLQSDTHPLYLHSLAPGANHVLINPHPQNGNVGIGTAAPAVKLHVSGNATVSGNLGIGVTSPSEKLRVAGTLLRVDGDGNEQAYLGGDGSSNIFGQDVQIGSLKSGVGEVHFWNRGNGSWMWLSCQGVDTFSDARLKTDIETLKGALGQVTRLRGVRFNWKQPEGTAARQRPGLGVIAQEVAEVAPDMVRQVRGSLSVSYQEFVPLLIEAVKELKAELDELRARMEGKEGKEGKKTVTKKSTGK
jgi:hypothetical protein